jgi:hypothetical protein
VLAVAHDPPPSRRSGVQGGRAAWLDDGSWGREAAARWHGNVICYRTSHKAYLTSGEQPVGTRDKDTNGDVMLAAGENEPAILECALAHSQSWFDLHANQRQNFLNFFLIAVAFLVNAYVGALAIHRYLLAIVIGLLGATISLAFAAMDLRNRDLTRAGEAAMREIEDRLARELGLPSLRIIETVDRPSRAWLSHGKIMRGIYITVALVFSAAVIYGAVV